jgi:alpha-glutamyl/putrescinyl thymine pyrophosphorylase clade 1
MASAWHRHLAYALTSIIGTVPLNWSCEISLNRKAVAGLSPHHQAIGPRNTNAEVLAGYGHKRKHRNHLKVIETMVAAQLPSRLMECKTLEAVFKFLRQFPCIGPFIGYQYAVDLNYSALVNFSEDEFVEPGPGALDGIAKCFSSLGDLTPADVIRYMTDVQERAFEQYAPGFRTLWGRRLHLIDCQNLFCEVSKYARVAHPEFGGLSRGGLKRETHNFRLRPVDKPIGGISGEPKGATCSL